MRYLGFEGSEALHVGSIYVDGNDTSRDACSILWVASRMDHALHAPAIGT